MVRRAGKPDQYPDRFVEKIAFFIRTFDVGMERKCEMKRFPGNFCDRRSPISTSTSNKLHPQDSSAENYSEISTNWRTHTALETLVGKSNLTP